MSNIVTLVVTESKIWNRDTAILNIVAAIKKFNSVVIDLRREGPCCHSLGLDTLLTSIIDYCGVDSSVVTIKTGNLLSSSKFVEQKFSQLITVRDWAPKDITVDLTHIPTKRFGIFIGRSNWLRLGIASYLYNKCKDSSIITFHYDFQDDFHCNHFGLEELLNKYPEDRSFIFNFVNQLPLLYDKVPTYPITGAAWNIVELYKDIFCDIVCETFYNGNTFFITEKTLRPILCRRPFLVQGPTHYLKNLQQLGFKTFNNWWNEDYDNDPSDARYATFKNQIDWIGSQSSNTVQQWYNEMKPILEHNYNVLQGLTVEKLLTTKFISNGIQ